MIHKVWLDFDITHLEQFVHFEILHLQLIVLADFEKLRYLIDDIKQDMTDKLMDLYLLHRMTIAMGMGSYLDDIMKLRIERHFADSRKYLKTATFANRSKVRDQ